MPDLKRFDAELKAWFDQEHPAKSSHE